MKELDFTQQIKDQLLAQQGNEEFISEEAWAAEENKGNFKVGGLFRTNAQTLDSNVTILATENAQVTGPLTVASGVTLTVESGGRLVTS